MLKMENNRNECFETTKQKAVIEIWHNYKGWIVNENESVSFKNKKKKTVIEEVIPGITVSVKNMQQMMDKRGKWGVLESMNDPILIQNNYLSQITKMLPMDSN